MTYFIGQLCQQDWGEGGLCETLACLVFKKRQNQDFSLLLKLQWDSARLCFPSL